MLAWILMKQIAVLFVMMGMGFALVKTGKLRAEDSKILSNLMIFLIFPAVILKSFQVEYSVEVRNGYFLALGVAIAIHIMLIIVTKILTVVLKLDPIEHASLMYSNCGNLILPLVTAVMGSEWLIYSSTFLCVQTVFIWTHAYAMLHDGKGWDVKSIFSNINLIATVVGVFLFFTRIPLPEIVQDTISGLAATIGPLSMIMLGMILTKVDWKALFTDKRVYLIVFLKMIALPMLTLVLLKFSGVTNLVPNGQKILLTSLLATITPVATSVTQLTILAGKDEVKATKINVFTTVVCIVTMPLLTAIYLA